MNNDPHAIIDHLSADDALAIVHALAREDDRLASLIAEVATSCLSSVDSEQIASDLYDELDVLDVEEVWDRSGATRHGYVEPQEAASAATISAPLIRTV